MSNKAGTRARGGEAAARPSPKASDRTGCLFHGIWPLFRALFPPLAVWKKSLPAFGWALLSALLLRLAYQPVDWSPLAFLALVPLFWGLRTLKPGMAFWPALLFASVMAWFFTGWLHVVSRFNPAVWLGIVPLALWIGLHAAAALSAIVYFARNLTPWAALAAAMLAWAGMEYFKMIGRLGLPYGLLGQSQAGWLAMAQVASIGGLPLLGALIIGTNLSLMETIAAFRARYGQAAALSRLTLFAILIFLAHGWGTRTIAATQERLASAEGTFTARIALVQPNIDQEVKFGSYADPDPAERRRLQDDITRRQFDMLARLEPGEADLIVLPESAFTQDFLDVEAHFQYEVHGVVVFERLREFADDLGIPIVLGGVDNVFATRDGEPTELLAEGMAPLTGLIHDGHQVYGGLWVVRPRGDGVPHRADYRKVRLMPFGEEVPYFDLIPGFQEKIVQVGTFGRGSPRQQPIGVAIPDVATDTPPEMRLGPSICYEDLFPNLHRRMARRGANLFVNSTNDAWFDGSAGPRWHADMARWRSIETRIPMVRSTNTGQTLAFDAAGRIVDQLPRSEEGLLHLELTLEEDPPRTLYVRLGDLPGGAALLLAVVWLGWLKRREWREEGA